MKPKRNLSERFFPERPRALWQKTRKLAYEQLNAVKRIGLPIASNAAYVSWLKTESMLYNANRLSRQYSGQGRMWQNPFARPRPRSAVNRSSVWFTAYPISTVTTKKSSVLATLADQKLWDTFKEIGITGIHTGPMKRAGGLRGWQYTASIDGHFDRISMAIDPMLGTEDEFKKMSEVAKSRGAIVIDDIVPGHTGKGADFRLAEMNYLDYPGIYHMVQVDRGHWNLLPEVPKGKNSVNLNEETEERLKKLGYIIGKMPRVIFYEPGVKETNWSVTGEVRGVDGVKRRWVYLHYFKAGQPSLNWLDPSFAGMRLVIGDALHSLGVLGSSALRLDANGFLGIEKTADDTPAWSEGHPLAEAANHLIAGTVRKLGGFTFQELNLSFDDIQTMGIDGADLSYDFISRPGYHHAVATGDTEFLRLVLREAQKIGIEPVSLVHALQNHDELTYELVHFWSHHANEMYNYHGKSIKGSELREIVQKDMKSTLSGDAAPYNKVSDNGVACTTASVITAALGYTQIHNLGDPDVEKIREAHLLLAMFNALQPGVFALSGWDLVGALTLPVEQVSELVADGDVRWVNRGAYDLTGIQPEAATASSGMPLAQHLYDTLPEQLKDEESFASRLSKILKIRDKYNIAAGELLDIPDVDDKAIMVLVHSLPQSEDIQVTVLNFSGKPLETKVMSEKLPNGYGVTDMFSDQKIGDVTKHSVTVRLNAHEGTSLLVKK